MLGEIKGARVAETRSVELKKLVRRLAAANDDAFADRYESELHYLSENWSQTIKEQSVKPVSMFDYLSMPTKIFLCTRDVLSNFMVDEIKQSGKFKLCADLSGEEVIEEDVKDGFEKSRMFAQALRIRDFIQDYYNAHSGAVTDAQYFNRVVFGNCKSWRTVLVVAANKSRKFSSAIGNVLAHDIRAIHKNYKKQEQR